MWLIKLHIAVSILLLLYIIGIRMLFDEKIRDNLSIWGKNNSSKLKKFFGNIELIFFMFVPILNFLFSISLSLVAFGTKKTMMSMYEQSEKQKQEDCHESN